MALISNGGFYDLKDRCISWCTGLHNRVRPTWRNKKTGKCIQTPLFENNVRSLLKLQRDDEQWEFCVTNYSSTDVDVPVWFEKLRVEFPNNKFHFRINTLPAEEFTRGEARNQAYKLATYDTVFFLDADMWWKDRRVIDNVYANTVKKNLAYFPICESFRDAEHKQHSKRMGHGNFSITKQLYDQLQVTWRSSKEWGKEDDEVFKLLKNKNKTIRDHTKTFFHQWHPKPGMSDNWCKDKNWELYLV